MPPGVSEATRAGCGRLRDARDGSACGRSGHRDGTLTEGSRSTGRKALHPSAFRPTDVEDGRLRGGLSVTVEESWTSRHLPRVIRGRSRRLRHVRRPRRAFRQEPVTNPGARRTLCRLHKSRPFRRRPQPARVASEKAASLCVSRPRLRDRRDERRQLSEFFQGACLRSDGPKFHQEAALNFLRRISTRRLLSICALALVLVIGGTAVALATSGGGPKPPPKPLANAVHDALERAERARHQRPDPLHQQPDRRLQHRGHRPAPGRRHRPPLGLARRTAASCGSSCRPKEAAATARCWSTATTSRSTTAPRKPSTKARCPKKKGEGRRSRTSRCPRSARSRRRSTEAGKHVDLSGAIPSDVAGQPTYTRARRAEPRRRPARRGRARLGRRPTASRCAPRSTPAKLGSPVLELEATDVSFEAVPASIFEISPPAGAKVVNLAPEERRAPTRRADRGGRRRRRSPKRSTSRSPRRSARRACREARSAAIEVDGKTAALVTYGKGLGGIAVIESKSEPGRRRRRRRRRRARACRRSRSTASRAKSSTPRSARCSASAAAASTTSSLGSVPPAAAEAAARAL